MAYSQGSRGGKRAKRKMRSRKQSKMSQAGAERLIQRALKSKGKGSVTRIWGMAKQAAAAGNIGVASSLGSIARKRGNFAYKIKNNAGFQVQKAIGL